MMLAASSTPYCAAQVPDQARFAPVDPPSIDQQFEIAAFTARYTVLRKGKPIGRLETRLSPTENGRWHYQFESVATSRMVRLLGISSFEQATFEWRDGQIVPIHYRLDSTGPGRDRYWAHQFDWPELSTITDTHEGPLQIALTNTSLDPLTLRLAVGYRLLPGYTSTETWQFDIVERDEVERQEIRLHGPEHLNFGKLCFDTIELVRFRREGSSRNYRAWHAPLLQGMAVKIRHEDADDSIEMILTEWQFDHPDLQGPEHFSCALVAAPLD